MQEEHKASCYCDSVVLELTLPNAIENPRRCDCSICLREGAILGSVDLGGRHIIEGKEVLKLYQFSTNTAMLYFSSICGIYTHHQPRSNSTEYAFNIGCLEGINPFDLGDVVTNDGVNHPADR